MIYRLEMENFYCFRSPQALDLTVPQTTPGNAERFEPIYAGSVNRAPKVVAIFGANASGKSTVLRALTFLSAFVQGAQQGNLAALFCQPFNDSESSHRPVRLAIEFGGAMEISNAAMEKVAKGEPVETGLYRYEVELVVENGMVRAIAREALTKKPEGKGRWSRVFERTLEGGLVGSKSFSLSGYAKLLDKLPNTSSVLPTLAYFKHEQALLLVQAAKTIFSNIPRDNVAANNEPLFQYLKQNPAVVDQLSKELQRIDVGITAMEMIDAGRGYEPWFRHEGLQSRMPWNFESQGTHTFIHVYPWLLAALQNGGIALIDELDIAIHPLILPEVTRWFYSRETNPRAAQLWMTGHSVSLLEDLEKEEIVLCEKDRQGRAEVYSLMDIKSVHRRDNLYKKYLGGVYGAVPHIG